MNEQVTSTMFALIRKVVCGAEMTEEAGASITPELLPQLYAVSKSHDMAHIVAQGLSDVGLLGADEISQKFQKQQMLAIYRYQKLNYELGRICQVLEDSKIAFIPLKGSVLRAYYPEPWMRTSCDVDVLVHESALEEAIDVLTSKLQYKNEGRGSHDVSLFSESGVHLELHYDLIEEVRYPTVVKQLTKVWEYAEPMECAAYQHQLKDEMFYFYHTSHMAKHFENGGCGIRSLLDQWILDHYVPHDRQTRNALLEEGGLGRFDTAAQNLAQVWFSGQTGTALTDAMSSYVITGGVYGNVENGVAIKRSHKGGKAKYIFSRLFLSYEILKQQYPILQKHRWLMPFFQIRRWFRLLCKGRLKSSLRELDVNQSISTEKISETSELLEKLGLQ